MPEDYKRSVCTCNVIERETRGGGTKQKVGGLTLPLNDCAEAGVQGLHSEEFHNDVTMPSVVSIIKKEDIQTRAISLSICLSLLSLSHTHIL